MALQTEFEFVLPKGFVDEQGNVHRVGTMRLATALDEIAPLRLHSGDDQRDVRLVEHGRAGEQLVQQHADGQHVALGTVAQGAQRPGVHGHAALARRPRSGRGLFHDTEGGHPHLPLRADQQVVEL